MCAKGSRQARQGHPRSRPHRYGPPILKEKKREGHTWQGRILTDMLRFPRWRDPGPRRVHGRHHPLHHPQRQGPRYEAIPTLRKGNRNKEANTRTQFVRTTFSAFSSPSVRPAVSDKRASRRACAILGLKQGEEECGRSFVAMFLFRGGCAHSGVRLLFGVNGDFAANPAVRQDDQMNT